MFAAVVIFFALTRTQVGRDGLRRELEHTFAKEFKGSLRIGQLKGNLVNDLFASDVRLLDPQGKTVLRVDSVVVRPRWRDLFDRHVSLGSVTLFRPDLELVRDAKGRWNLAQTLEKRRIRPKGEPWSFTSAGLKIREGAVRTRNLGAPVPAVARGTVFDYTNTRLQSIDAELTIDWQKHLQLLDIAHLQADAPDLRMRIAQARGRASIVDDLMTLDGIDLAAGASRVRFTARVNGLKSGRADRTQLDLDLARSNISFAELQRIVPVLPLDDAATVRLRARGTLADLKIDRVQLERAKTHLNARGRLTGLPSKPAFALDLDRSRIDGYDLEALLPRMDFSAVKRVGLIDGTARINGSWLPARQCQARHYKFDGRVALTAEAGTIQGTIAASRERGTRTGLRGNLAFRRLDLSRVLPDGRFATTLSGRTRFDGTAGSPTDLAGNAWLTLGPSVVAGRSIDTLGVELSAAGGTVQAFARAARRGGVVDAEGTLLLGTSPAYNMEVVTTALDLGSIVQNDSLRTSLNARFHLNGAGLSLNDFHGKLVAEFDSSTVRWDRTARNVIPHTSTLTVSDPSEPGRRISLSGDIAELDLEGSAPAGVMALVTGFWSQVLGEALQQELDKPYNGLAAAQDIDTLTIPVPAHLTAAPEPGSRIRRLLQNLGADSLTNIQASLKIKRADILTALLPALPPIATDLSADLSILAGAADLQVRGNMTADSLLIGGVRVTGLRTVLSADANLRAPIRETLKVRFDSRADTAQVAKQAFRMPHLVVMHQDATAQIAFSTVPYSRQGSASMSAELRLLPDRNRLSLQGIQVDVGGIVWNNPRDYIIDVYRDAAVVPELVLESEGEPGLPQRIRLAGRLSNAPGDTLMMAADRISLHRLSDLFGIKLSIGGLATARLALAGGLRAPELTGGVDVADLSLDNRLLGRLSVASHYVPGTTDVALDARLEPMPEGAPIPKMPKSNQAMIAEENRLHLGGLFRLPRYDKIGREVSPGALDLALDVTRADLFFFEYIFKGELQNVRGFVSGNGKIGGTLTHPVFEADARIREGHFEIPKFNLAYDAEGPVRVDRQGIHVLEGSVRDKTGGTASVRGSVLFNDYRYWSLDLAAHVSKIQIIDVTQSRDLAFYGKIWATGDVTLSGPIYNAVLRSTNAATTPESEIYIPIIESGTTVDTGFIVYADSTGQVPDLNRYVRRASVLSQRAAGERPFLEGLDMDLGIAAPQGSTIHLVMDPLLGDEMNAVGAGRIQLQRREGEYFTYGSLDVSSGDYLFTAGDVFFRRFLIDGGTISWDGDPTDAVLDVDASYRTRASRAGLENEGSSPGALIPLNVQLHVTGRVSAPEVDLNLEVDRSSREFGENLADQRLEAILKEPEHSAEYATSVLLTNSFLLTTNALSAGMGGGTDGTTGGYGLADTRNQFAFNSVSQLVASQINRYVNQAVPNLDLNFGVQGDRAQDLDVTYGVALRLMDERLIIRGQGVYQNEQQGRTQGEFVVEVRLSPAVSVEVFYRREDDAISEEAIMNTTGAGLSYQTQFVNWKTLFRRVFGWVMPRRATSDTDLPTDSTGVAEEL